MSTRSYIGLKKNDTVEITYCHYDGYPSTNGAILLTFYDTQKKVEDLICNGTMRCLGAKAEDTNYFDEEMSIYNIDFDKLDGWLNDSWAEYCYLYDVDTSTWIYKSIGENNHWDYLINSEEAVEALDDIIDYFEKKEEMEKENEERQ